MSSSNAHDGRSRWLQRYSDRFAERNLPLLAALGAVALSAKLDAFIQRQCRSVAPTHSDEDPAVTAAVLDLTLGAVAISKRVQVVVADWARHAGTRPEPTKPSAARTAPELLR